MDRIIGDEVKKLFLQAFMGHRDAVHARFKYLADLLLGSEEYYQKFGIHVWGFKEVNECEFDLEIESEKFERLIPPALENADDKTTINLIKVIANLIGGGELTPQKSEFLLITMSFLKQIPDELVDSLTAVVAASP